jgi:NADH pyrophosphatase NudC (nudix superfamily)
LAEEREDGFREGFEVGAKRANKELEKQVLEVKASAQNELEEAVKKAREEARIGFCIRCGLKTHPKNTKARLCKKCRLNHTRWESKIDAAVLARTKKIFEEIDKLCYSEQGDHWLKKMNLTVEEKEKIKSRFFGGK